MPLDLSNKILKNLFLAIVIVLFTIETRVSFEVVSSLDVDNTSQTDVSDEIQFQRDMLELTDGKYKDLTGPNKLSMTNVSNNCILGEFSEGACKNDSFISRYVFAIYDQSENQIWSRRVLIANRFASVNLESGEPVERMISNTVSDAGVVKVEQEGVYIVTLLKDYGHNSLVKLLANDTDFQNYMADPHQRLEFYIDLILIWQSLIDDLGFQICHMSLKDITVRIPENSQTKYMPMFRNPEFSVRLSEVCDYFDPGFASQSVILQTATSMASYQKLVEVFSLGRLIMVIEAIVAIQVFGSQTDMSSFSQQFDQYEKDIKEERKKENYSTTKLDEENDFLETQIVNLMTQFPNGNVKEVFAQMFPVLKEMMRENNFSSGRPTLDQVFNKFLEFKQLLQIDLNRNILLV